ncbi:MAG TPA: hypothetical protein PLD37_11880, partial [Usitatibacteraceae bacterium]|nr:hypothetical protein [Usitatibacteraceae bacterium]
GPSEPGRIPDMALNLLSISGPLYTTRSAVPGGHAEVIVWEQSGRCDPVLRQWYGNPTIALALLKGLRALQAQGRAVRSESLSPSGTAQALVCWRLRTAPGATT